MSPAAASLANLGLQTNALIVFVIAGLLCLLCLIIFILGLILSLQLRKQNRAVDKANLNILDIYELLFSGKDVQNKVNLKLTQLTESVEANKSQLAYLADEPLNKIQQLLEVETEALKRINQNMLVIYKNLLKRKE